MRLFFFFPFLITFFLIFFEDPEVFELEVEKSFSQSDDVEMNEEVPEVSPNDEWMFFCGNRNCQRNEQKLIECEGDLKQALGQLSKYKLFEALCQVENVPPLPKLIAGWKKWKETQEILVNAAKELPSGSRDVEVLYSLKWGIGDVWGKKAGFWKNREDSFKKGFPGVLKAAPPADVDPITKKKREVWITFSFYFANFLTIFFFSYHTDSSKKRYIWKTIPIQHCQ